MDQPFPIGKTYPAGAKGDWHVILGSSTASSWRATLCIIAPTASTQRGTTDGWSRPEFVATVSRASASCLLSGGRVCVGWDTPLEGDTAMCNGTWPLGTSVGL